MNLNAYAAEKKRAIYEELKQGRSPSEGTFEVASLEQGRLKGEPQVGTTRFLPGEIILEFIFPDPKSSATIFTVHLESPERIVYMAVPAWVVESIWEGEVSGSYHFESDAKRLLDEFAATCEPGANAEGFTAVRMVGRH